MIKAVIFDCFGVLATSFSQTMVDKYPFAKADIDDLNHASDHGYIDRDEYARRLGEILQLDEQNIHELMQDAVHGVIVNEPLLALILDLRKKYKIGVLSNVGQGLFEQLFPPDTWAKYFDDVILSSKVNLVKPQPEIYELAAERLGVKPEECVFVDDRSDNIAGAEVVGMCGVCYDSLDSFRNRMKQLVD